MSPQSYRDLVAWQKAMDLANDVYAVTSAFPRQEMYGLVAQMRRSAVSIASNIAEGSGRLSPGEWAQFLGQARGSCCEAQTQLLLAARMQLGPAEELTRLADACDEVARVINGLLRSTSGVYKGRKFSDSIRDGDPPRSGEEPPLNADWLSELLDAPHDR